MEENYRRKADFEPGTSRLGSRRSTQLSHGGSYLSMLDEHVIVSVCV